MPKVDLFNMNGDVVGEIQLADEIFGSENINETVIHQVVKQQLANKRQAHSLQRPALKSAAAERNLTDKRVPAEQDRALSALPSIGMAALCLRQSRGITALAFLKR